MQPNADRIGLLGFGVTYLHRETDSGRALLSWDAPPRAGGIPVHVHERTEEGFYVLRGQLALWRDGDVVVRGTGSYTVVRSGQQHSFWNPADEPAAYLTAIVPPGIADYLRELAQGLRDAQSEEQATALRARLSARYDFRVVGPPPPR